MSKIDNKLISYRSIENRGYRTPCWIWTGCLNSDGYGYLWVDGKSVGVHRLAYKISNPDFKISLNVLHLCNTPPCFNPEHLYQGTQSMNAQDRVVSGRDFNKSKILCKRGHLLTGENVRRTSLGGRQCVICKMEYDNKRFNGGQYSKSKEKLRILKENYSEI